MLECSVIYFICLHDCSGDLIQIENFRNHKHDHQYLYIPTF